MTCIFAAVFSAFEILFIRVGLFTYQESIFCEYVGCLQIANSYEHKACLMDIFAITGLAYNSIDCCITSIDRCSEPVGILLGGRDVKNYLVILALSAIHPRGFGLVFKSRVSRDNSQLRLLFGHTGVMIC